MAAEQSRLADATKASEGSGNPSNRGGPKLPATFNARRKTVTIGPGSGGNNLGSLERGDVVGFLLPRLAEVFGDGGRYGVQWVAA